MIRSALLLTGLVLSARPELVEGRVTRDASSSRASTSSARTAGAQTPIEAERAFAADARALGQWTAFRKWAAADAVMFVPQPTNAQAWLKDRKDPAKAIEWWPTASYVSCDGTLAVNTGGWKRADGSVGYFTTVWQRQADGSWKWIVDSGDDLKMVRPKPATPMLRRGSCTEGAFAARLDDERFQPQATGNAMDGSLYWHWIVKADRSRRLTVGVWNGHDFDAVIDDRIAAPTQ